MIRIKPMAHLSPVFKMLSINRGQFVGKIPCQSRRMRTELFDKTINVVCAIAGGLLHVRACHQLVEATYRIYDLDPGGGAHVHFLCIRSLVRHKTVEDRIRIDRKVGGIHVVPIHPEGQKRLAVQNRATMPIEPHPAFRKTFQAGEHANRPSKLLFADLERHAHLVRTECERPDGKPHCCDAVGQRSEGDLLALWRKIAQFRAKPLHVMLEFVDRIPCGKGDLAICRLIAVRRAAKHLQRIDRNRIYTEPVERDAPMRTLLRPYVEAALACVHR